MKILIINASPRREGTVWKMLDAVRREAEAQGHDVAWEWTSQWHVHPCTGCMTCRRTGQCTLPPDDAQRVLALIDRADALVVGSPAYWGNLPGPLKTALDRMVYGLMKDGAHGIPRPLHRGKRAIVIAACTTPWPFNVWLGQSRGVVRALRQVLRSGGFKIAAVVERGGTRTRPLTERDLQRCRRAVRRL